jgi:Raf kinase inhibitor-like YbhB/YbcL family protein
MIITSPSFNDGEMIPEKFTCDAGDFNPELQIQNVPPDAKSLALVLHDPDAPMPGGFMHWVVWNIKPETTLIKEESTPPKSVEGKNSAGENQYTGPCPPSGTHHYEFWLYALNILINLPENTEPSDAWKEIKAHAIAEAKLVGLYGR